MKTRRTKPASVLAVDPEHIVLAVIRAILHHLGYGVEVADNESTALDLLRAREDIRILLLDLELADALPDLTSAKPGIRVIVATDWDPTVASQRLRHSGVSAYLRKPFTARQLASKVETALAA